MDALHTEKQKGGWMLNTMENILLNKRRKEHTFLGRISRIFKKSHFS